MKTLSFSEELRKKGAGKGLVARAKELEDLDRAIHRLGGLDQVEKCVRFFDQWAPVVVTALIEESERGK